MATLEYKLVYNPEWHTPLVVMDNGTPVYRITLPDPPTQTTLEFRITTENVTFSNLPSQWFLGDPVSWEVTEEGKLLTLVVDPPVSTIRPHAFSVVADVPAPSSSSTTIYGVRSDPAVFVTLAELQPPSSTLLKYDTTNGAFEMSGIDLKPGELLVFLAGGSIDIQLTDQNGQTRSDLRFSQNAIAWMSETSPTWLAWSWPGLPRDTIRMTNDFSTGIGLAAPFHFVIEYQGLTIKSPDPIIVNAPIGDGSD